MPVLIRAVKASGGSPSPVLPNDMDCGEITIDETVSAISIPYDATRTPIVVTLFRRNQNTYLRSSSGVGQSHIRYDDGTWSNLAKSVSGGGAANVSSSYGHITIDSATGMIELQNRFQYRDGTYVYTIQYAST